MVRVKKIRYWPPIPWSISCFLKRAAYTTNAHRPKRSPLKNWPLVWTTKHFDWHCRHVMGWLPAMPITYYNSAGTGDQAAPPVRSDSNDYDKVLSEKRRKVEPPKEPRELAQVLMRDLKHYEATGLLSEPLKLLRRALSGIPPTSVESEESNNSIK